jgi:DNA mismatch repair protein MLH1
MGENTADVHTQQVASVKDNIRVLFGNKVTNELIEIDFNDDQKLKFSVKGYLTNPNYKSKKSVFILFINSTIHTHTHTLL